MAASTNYIGVFWDIENCQIPRGKSPLLICKKIRDLEFFKGYKEIQFAVACDAARESSYILDDLNKAQVDVFHVNSSSKNAADKKLKVLMRRFVNLHGSNSRIVLISGDGDFTDDIFDIKTHKEVEILVVYPHKASDALKSFAHNTISFADLVSDVRGNVETHLKVTNLPSQLEDEQLNLDSENTLSELVHAFAGRIINLETDNGTAILAFDSAECARRFREKCANYPIGSRKMLVQNYQWRGSRDQSSPPPHRRPPRGHSLGRQAQAEHERVRCYSSNENLSVRPAARPSLLPTPVSHFTPVLPPTTAATAASFFDNVAVPATELNPPQFSTFSNPQTAQQIFFQPISSRSDYPTQQRADNSYSSQRINHWHASNRAESATSTVSRETQYSSALKAEEGRPPPLTVIREPLTPATQPMLREPITPSSVAIREQPGTISSSSKKARRQHIKNRKSSEATKEFLDKDNIFYQILAAESLEEEINQCLYRSIGEFNVEKSLTSGITTLKLKLKSYDEAILIRDKLEKRFSSRQNNTTAARLLSYECVRFSDEKIVRIISILNKIVREELSSPAEKMYLELYNEEISPVEVKDALLVYRRQSSVDPGDFSGTRPTKSARQFCLDILDKEGSMSVTEFQELVESCNDANNNDLLINVLMGQDKDLCLVVGADQGEIVIPRTGRVLARFLFEAHLVCARHILDDDDDEPWAHSIPLDRFRAKLATMFPDAQMLTNLPTLSASQLTFSDTCIRFTPIFLLCCYVLRVRGDSRLPLAVAEIDGQVSGISEFIEKNILCSDIASVFLKMEYFFYLYNDRSMIGLLDYDEDLFCDVYRVRQEAGPLSLGWSTEDWEYLENLLDLAGLSLPDQHYTTPLKHYKQQRQNQTPPSHQYLPTASQQPDQNILTVAQQFEQNLPTASQQQFEQHLPKDSQQTEQNFSAFLQHHPAAYQQKPPPPDLIGDVVGAGCTLFSARGASPSLPAWSAAVKSPVKETSSSSVKPARGSSSPLAAGDLNASIDSSSGLKRILGSGGTRGARSLRQEQIFSQAQRAPHAQGPLPQTQGPSHQVQGPSHQSLVTPNNTKKIAPPQGRQGELKQELTLSPIKQEAFKLIQPKKEELKLDESWNMDLRKLSGLRIQGLDVFQEKEDSEASDLDLEAAGGNHLLSSASQPGHNIIVVPESSDSSPHRSLAGSPALKNPDPHNIENNILGEGPGPLAAENCSILGVGPCHLADTSRTPPLYTWITTPEYPRSCTQDRTGSNQSAAGGGRKNDDASSRRKSKLAANFNFLPK